MDETLTPNQEAATPVIPVEGPVISAPPDGRVRPSRDSRLPRNRSRRQPRREERARPEFDQKIVSLRRVTRVVAGGRRFSFSVALVAGNRKGMVGVGTGKAGDTALAIEKAFRDAKKHMVTVLLNDKGNIPHDSRATYASSDVLIMPALGRGLVAGGSVRTVLEFAGIKDVSGKILSRSKNALNNARAAVRALQGLRIRRTARH